MLEASAHSQIFCDINVNVCNKPEGEKIIFSEDDLPKHPFFTKHQMWKFRGDAAKSITSQ